MIRNIGQKSFTPHLSQPTKPDIQTSSSGAPSGLLRCISKVVNRKGVGFTLIELLAAVAIFFFVVSISTGVLLSAFSSQRRTFNENLLFDQVSYTLEYMSRAIRMSQKDLTGSCLGAGFAKYNYVLVANGIRFLNYYNKCQEFYRSGTVLMTRTSSDESWTNFGAAATTTSNRFSVNSFNIGPSGSWDQDDDFQPRVTLFLDIQGTGEKPELRSQITIQTSISQRNLDIKK